MERGRGPGQEMLYLRDQIQLRTAPVLCLGGGNTGKVGSFSSLAGATEACGNGKLREASLAQSVSVKVTEFCVRAQGVCPSLGVVIMCQIPYCCLTLGFRGAAIHQLSAEPAAQQQQRVEQRYGKPRHSGT